MNSDVIIQSNKRNNTPSPLRFVLLGYLGMILVGAFLLCLPISNTNGKWLNFTDSLFTATSTICVTGLAVLNYTTSFTFFGKLILLILIQIGGIGFMTVTTILLLILGKRITINDRLAIEDSLNADKMSGLIKLIIKIVLMTAIIEFIGAALLSIRFISLFGVANGIFYSFFISISSFCSAGIEIISISQNSLVMFRADYYVNIIICILMFLGSFGYIAIFDVLKNRKLKKLGVYTKIIILMNVIMISISTLIYYVGESANSLTLGTAPFFEKLTASFFQATARSAGFYTIEPSLLSSSSQFLSLLNMFIGGSPTSTASGLKVTTLFVLIMAVFSGVNGKNDVVAFKRTISRKTVSKAFELFVLMLCIIVISVISISLLQNELSLYEIIFEVISAISTAGLSIGLTMQLVGVSKYIIMMIMFMGRVGLLTIIRGTFSIEKNKKINVKYPEIDIII